MTWSVFRIHPLPGKTGPMTWVLTPLYRLSLLYPYHPQSPCGFGIGFERLLARRLQNVADFLVTIR